HPCLGTAAGTSPRTSHAGVSGAGVGAVSTRELGRRLQRDPSMISRLASRYAMQRDEKAEAHLRKALNQ
ncbi:MAG TPA: hypothetical protein VLA99_02725, partial [Nitrospiraceae bacterium]|nr:hypothetical protein [Nitrospiraceae bacterium]